MEALVSGVPLVASDCIGLREVIEDTPALVFRNGDARGLAAALRRVLDGGEAGRFRDFRDRAAERFDVRRNGHPGPGTVRRGLRGRGAGGGSMSVRVSAWAAAGVLALSLVLGLTAGPCAAPDSLPGLPGWIKSPNAFSLAGEQDGLEAGVRPVPVPPRRNVVEISAPGVLDRPDTVYRLTKDVVADGTAFQIVKSSITLDLNGHTVTYGQKDVPGDSYGVHFTGAWHHDDVAVYNGRIVQGAAAGSGPWATSGAAPMARGSTPSRA
jgi:hypothetical protein